MIKPIVIGDRRFSRRMDAEAEIQRIFESVGTGVVTDPADELLLMNLLLLHPRAAEKIGPGVQHFAVGVNPMRTTTYTPYLVRVDGSQTDFSWHKCVHPLSHAHEVRDALRRAVDDQIAAFRYEEFDKGRGRCSMCNLDLSGNGGHVDHQDPTFVDLAMDYVASQGGSDAFDVIRSDGMLGARLADAVIANAWAEHHRRVAVLRMLCAPHNLHRLKGPRRLT